MGQHFLIDENILDKIIAALLGKDDLVLDIGAGRAISLAIARKVAGLLR